jgi:hypothetical protein
VDAGLRFRARHNPCATVLWIHPNGRGNRWLPGTLPSAAPALPQKKSSLARGRATPSAPADCLPRRQTAIPAATEAPALQAASRVAAPRTSSKSRGSHPRLSRGYKCTGKPPGWEPRRRRIHPGQRQISRGSCNGICSGAWRANPFPLSKNMGWTSKSSDGRPCRQGRTGVTGHATSAANSTFILRRSVIRRLAHWPDESLKRTNSPVLSRKVRFFSSHPNGCLTIACSLNQRGSVHPKSEPASKEQRLSKCAQLDGRPQFLRR